MRTHAITNPTSGNPVGEPQQFNLMFASSIGPTGQHPGCVLSFLFRFVLFLVVFLRFAFFFLVFSFFVASCAIFSGGPAFLS